jgi:hypothetical protein
MFTPERIVATAIEVVKADGEGHREEPSIVRARATIVACERKLAKHLDGLEAGIPADVIATRIEATQREKAAAETVLAAAPSAPEPLTFDEVVDTLKALRDLPQLLETIDQADRAALYQALGLTLRYRRDNGSEQVRLTTTFSSLDLAQISLGPAAETVDLKRVGGGT